MGNRTNHEICNFTPRPSISVLRPVTTSHLDPCRSRMISGTAAAVDPVLHHQPHSRSNTYPTALLYFKISYYSVLVINTGYQRINQVSTRSAVILLSFCFFAIDGRVRSTTTNSGALPHCRLPPRSTVCTSIDCTGCDCLSEYILMLVRRTSSTAWNCCGTNIDAWDAI